MEIEGEVKRVGGKEGVLHYLAILVHDPLWLVSKRRQGAAASAPAVAGHTKTDEVSPMPVLGDIHS